MPLKLSVVSPNLSQRRQTRKPSNRSKGGIVVTQSRAASEAGARVLKAGGNAVDAAIAAAFAVGVVEPWMSGIGGIGGMLVYQAKSGKVTGIDFGPRSPIGLDPAAYPLTGAKDVGNLFGWAQVVDNANTTGPKSIVAPTEPAAMALAHKTFGRAKWADLVRPAAKLAEEGLAVDWNTSLVITGAFADLMKDAGARERFLPAGVPPIAPAAQAQMPLPRLKAPALARTLATIAEEGVEPFYRGAIARSIAADMKALGGFVTEADLAAVTPRLVEPLVIEYGGRRIHVLPELNGGPTLSVAWSELKKLRPVPAGSAPDAAAFTAWAKALTAAWHHRFEHMGDAGLRTAPTSTTHLSVVDRDGNMVTLTQTLLSLFGSKVVLPTSGILMNNGINWYDPIPGRPNSIAPNRRALANYAPSIMLGGGEAIAIGGCGGRRILPAVFQLLTMAADYGFDLDRAFHEPRIDVSGVEAVAIDRRLPEAVQQALIGALDVVLAEPAPYPFPFTIASAVRRKGADNEGATEPEHPTSEAVSEDDV